MDQQSLALKPGQVQIAIKRSGDSSIFPQVWLNPACQIPDWQCWSLLLLSSSVQVAKGGGKGCCKAFSFQGIFYSKADTWVCIWVQ